MTADPRPLFAEFNRGVERARDEYALHPSAVCLVPACTDLRRDREALCSHHERERRASLRRQQLRRARLAAQKAAKA